MNKTSSMDATDKFRKNKCNRQEQNKCEEFRRLLHWLLVFVSVDQGPSMRNDNLAVNKATKVESWSIPTQRYVEVKLLGGPTVSELMVLTGLRGLQSEVAGVILNSWAAPPLRLRYGERNTTGTCRLRYIVILSENLSTWTDSTPNWPRGIHFKSSKRSPSRSV